MHDYQGILFFGQSLEYSGRGISGFRLRTAAQHVGYNVLMIDFMGDLSDIDIFKIIEKYNVAPLKFLGFSTSWLEEERKKYSWFHEDFFVELKKRFSNLLIISGGHEFHYKNNTLPKYSDYHFHGFSDNTFTEFLKHINNKEHNLQLVKKPSLFNGLFIDSNNTNPVVNPDDIETVLVKEDGFLPYQPVPIEISRGCIFRCAFCRHPFLGKKDYDSYQRTPESIGRELARNYELFGTTRYTIMDDTFNDSSEKIDRLKRAIEIAKLPNFEFVAYIRPELLVTKPEMINDLSSIGLRGAFFGVESFNETARRAIGKGKDVNLIIDAGMKLSEKGALVHASFIIGLPGESEDDIRRTQEYLLSGKGPFRSWMWQPLGIRNHGNTGRNTESLFDKDFEKYGYKIPPGSNQWRNEYFTRRSSVKLTQELMIESLPYQKYGGWRVAGGWHINKTDHQLENEIIDATEFINDVRKISSERTAAELKRLLG